MRISYQAGEVSVRDVAFDAQLTLIDSAQVFHWKKEGAERYSCVTAGRHVTLIAEANGFRLSNAASEDIPFWRNYFDLDRDYQAIARACEPYPLAREAVERLPGLRVLNQPAWETLLTFILSANNNVTRIRRLVESLKSVFGTEDDFPTPERLSQISEEQLRAIGCGYRAPYLIQTAAMVRDGFPLESLKDEGYESAHKRLLELPGVGDKVADCVQLFGMGQSEAFPVDVWVERLMKKWFAPDARNKREMRAAAHEMFGENAGIVQQYLFHCARLGLISLE